MMIFDAWLDLPQWGIFASLMMVLGLSTAAVNVFSTARATESFRSRYRGFVAPYFTAISILFALMTGFLANGVWERERDAYRAVLTEQQAILTLDAIAVAELPHTSEIRAAAQAYIRLLIDDEWKQMRMQQYSPLAEKALGVLLRNVADSGLGAVLGAAGHAALLNATLAVREARAYRLQLSHGHTDMSMWLTVIVLALITQVSLALVHLDAPRAARLAVQVFSLAAIITLGLVAGRERPFDGAASVSAAPLQTALQTMQQQTMQQ